MIKLVVSDLDGTLLPRGEENINKEVIGIINKLLEKDIYFAIASGRTYKELSNFMKKLKHSIFLISENGALITYRGKVLKKDCMEKCNSINLIREIEKQGYECLISGFHTLYTTSKKQTYTDYLTKTKGSITKLKEIEDLPEDPLRISIYKKGNEILNKEWVIKAKRNFNVSYYGEEWLDFTRLGVNKGMAMEEIKKSFLNKEDEIMAFGDQNNDKEMLIIADYSFAMSNGNEEIMKICNEIIDNPIKTIKNQIKID